MKKLVCLVMIVSLFTIIFATPVSLADVQTAAVNWMVHLTGESEAISNYVTETDSLGTPLLHRIDFIDGGYVIATANDLVYPILGYSETGTITGSLCLSVRELLDSLIEQIVIVTSGNYSGSVTTAQWNSLLTNNIPIVNERVEPRLTTNWEQNTSQSGVNYWQYTPTVDLDGDGIHTDKTLVGCVPIAYSQVANYYKNLYSYHFQQEIDDYCSISQCDNDVEILIDNDANEYIFPNFQTLNNSLDLLNQTVYPTASLSELNPQHLDLIYKFIFSVGILAKAHYGTGLTIASFFGNPLLKFGYWGEYKERSQYSNQEWNEMLRDCLDSDENLVIPYSGVNYQGAGHAYVIDGYQTTDEFPDYFHVNLGWNDSYNRYYCLEASPTDMNNYFSNQKGYFNYKFRSFTGSFTCNTNISIANQIKIQVLFNNQIEEEYIIQRKVSDNALTRYTFGMSTQNFDQIQFIPCYNGETVTSYSPLEYSLNGGYTDYQFLDFSFSNPNAFIVPSTELPTLQLAINYIQANNISNAEIWLDNGTHTLEAPVVIETDLSLYSLNGSSSCTIIPQTSSCTINYNSSSITQSSRVGGIKFTGFDYEPAISITNGASPVIIGNTFYQNQDSSSELDPKLAGSLYLCNTYDVRIISCRFDSNAARYGGACRLFNADKTSIEDCFIKMNSAINGGGIFCESSNDVSITECLLRMNDLSSSNGTTKGGAIYLYDSSDVAVSSSSFSQNSADEGSSIFADDCLVIALNDNSYSTETINEAGALYFKFTNTITLENEFASGNTSLDASFLYGYYCNNIEIIDSSIIDNNSSGKNTIELDNCGTISCNNNQFLGNEANDGSAGLLFDTCSNIDLIGNTFGQNYLLNPPLNSSNTSSALTFSSCTINNNLNIQNNIFAGIEEFAINFDNCSINSPQLILNCNFENITANGADNLDVLPVLADEGDNISYLNCIFVNPDNLTVEFSPTPLIVDYCVFNGQYNGSLLHNSVNTNPQLNNSDEPIWSETVKSPCINAGDPDLDGDEILWYKDLDDCDPDKSRKDIGAKPYLPMEDGEYVVENSVIELTPDGINWLCIPGLDGYRGEDYIEAGYVFGEQASEYLFLIDDPILSRIGWDYDQTGAITLFGGSWTGLTHVVTSTKGYLIELNETNATEPVYIEFDGFSPGSNHNEETQIVVQEYSGTGLPEETLVGYFLRNSQNIFEAIPAASLDKLSRIDTRYWCAINLSLRNCPEGQSTTGTTWLTGLQAYHPATLNYGEAVKLYTQYNDNNPNTTSFEFTWQNTNPSGSPIIVDLPTIFTYEEQEGYYPIVCEFDLDGYDEGDKPIEIAVFVDDECKGAEVIKSDDVILKAYVVNDPDLVGEEMTFQLAYLYKGEKKSVTDYAVMDEAEKRYVTKKLLVNSDTDVAFVSFKSEDIQSGAIPAITTLKGNYPNPFNPTTTISYDIASETDVRLDVYNIRGQKVTTLVNDHLTPGYHTVVWDGTDKNKKQVASGVYFYRLKADHKTLTKKMMLLK